MGGSDPFVLSSWKVFVFLFGSCFFCDLVALLFGFALG